MVKTWFKTLGNISREKKLTFLYLANDVVQNSKKKFPDYAKEFGHVMKKVSLITFSPLEEYAS